MADEIERPEPTFDELIDWTLYPESAVPRLEPIRHGVKRRG